MTHLRTKKHIFPIGTDHEKLKIVHKSIPQAIHGSEPKISQLNRLIQVKFAQSCEGQPQEPQVQIEFISSLSGLGVHIKPFITDGQTGLAIIDNETNLDHDSVEKPSLMIKITIQLPKGKKATFLDIISTCSIYFQSSFSGAMFQNISLHSDRNILCAKLDDPQSEYDAPENFTAKTTGGGIEGSLQIRGRCHLETDHGAINGVFKNLYHDLPTKSEITAKTNDGDITGEFHLVHQCHLETNSGLINSVIVRPRCHLGLESELVTENNDGGTNLRIQELVHSGSDGSLCRNRACATIEDDDKVSNEKHLSHKGFKTRHESTTGSINVTFPDTWKDSFRKVENYNFIAGSCQKTILFGEKMVSEEPNPKRRKSSGFDSDYMSDNSGNSVFRGIKCGNNHAEGIFVSENAFVHVGNVYGDESPFMRLLKKRQRQNRE